MKAKEARNLVGMAVEWDVDYCGYAKTFLRTGRGVIKEVDGQNVRMEQAGMEDWLWLPDLTNLRENEDDGNRT